MNETPKSWETPTRTVNLSSIPGEPLEITHAPSPGVVTEKMIKEGTVPVRELLFAMHGELTSKAFDLMKKKNLDYGSKQDPFSNFRLHEQVLGRPAEEAILSRMTDKLARLGSYLQKGKFEVKEEGVNDCLVDIINYCVLLKGCIELKE